MLEEAALAYRELGIAAEAEVTEHLLSALAAAAGPVGANVFRCEGEFWTLAYAGRQARVKSTKGLGDIAVLVASPGREVHVADLITAGTGPSHRRAGTGGGEAVLDAQARSAYRARLAELAEELEEAESNRDPVRAARARAEMDFIAGELASALGLGGRPRRAGDPAERARKAVAQRIRNALRRLETHHPELARHLEHSLRTGTFCSYSPERPTAWEF